jgi:predicted porin
VTVLAAFVPNTQQSLGLDQNTYAKQSSYTLRASYDSNGIFGAVSLASIGANGVAINPSTATGANKMTAGKDAKITITSFAGGYDFGMAKVRAQLVQSSADKAAMAGALDALAGAGTSATNSLEAKQTVIALGGQIKVSEDGTVNLQYAKAQAIKLTSNIAAATVTSLAHEDKTGASLIAVGYDHALSKNTTIYAAYAKVSNGNYSQFSATGYAHGGVGAPGTSGTPATAQSPSALSLGMIRNF